MTAAIDSRNLPPATQEPLGALGGCGCEFPAQKKKKRRTLIERAPFADLFRTFPFY